MEKTEELLIGIENVLSIANDLVGEITRLKSIEEEFKIMKEQLFLSQFTRAERDVFELAIDGLSSSEMAKWLYKERSTISQQRKDICKKLGVKNIKEAVALYEKIAHDSHEKFAGDQSKKSQKLFAI
jgi:DNA-binding CsgD family transcriptional regulator